MATKIVGLRKIKKVGKLTLEFGLLRSITSKHFTRRDRNLLMERLARDGKKIQRVIEKDLAVINNKITREEKSKTGSQRLLMVIDEVLIELNEKQRVFERQVKLIKERRSIISNKRVLVIKRIKKSNYLLLNYLLK